MGSVIVRTASNILSLLAEKLSKSGDALTGNLQALDGAKFQGGSTTADEHPALEMMHGNEVIGIVGSRYGFAALRSTADASGIALLSPGDAGAWMGTDGKFSFDLQPTFPYTPGEDPNFDTGIQTMVEQTLAGGASGHLLGKNKFLPGRPLSTVQQLVQIPAFHAWISIFRVTETRTAPGIAYSISTAAPAGSKARVSMCTWDWDLMRATRRDGYSEINIDATGNYTLAAPGGMTDLEPGDYAAMIIPSAAVTFRMLQVHDMLYGAQSASGMFDPNADRANPAFVANQGSYPASSPGLVNFTTAYTHVSAKQALTWMVLV